MISTKTCDARVGLLALVSWSGMIIHNRIELPELALFRPEYLIPTAISIVLLSGWYAQETFRRLYGWLLFLWTATHFVIGAVLSVAPLSIWPFIPEQSIPHYAAHALYGFAQIPLIWRLLHSLMQT